MPEGHQDKDRSPFRSASEKEAERQAKRHAVLRAAVKMFNERGFHATSLDDVAASIGISKRTIYHYISNKDQVLLECLTIGLRQLLEAAESARDAQGSGCDRLAAFIGRYVEINLTDFGRCVVRTGEVALAPDSLPKFRALKREIDVAMRCMIEDAIADGTLAKVDVKMAAFTLDGALNWPARWYDPDGELTPQQIAQTVSDLMIRGFAPRS